MNRVNKQTENPERRMVEQGTMNGEYFRKYLRESFGECFSMHFRRVSPDIPRSSPAGFSQIIT